MFCIAHNESGDYFVIPVEKQDDWEDWLYSERVYTEETPSYATYIGGFPTLIQFPCWKKL